ncbi:hypothetical protein [Enterobacter kobei]|uniref:hypothetical protein n=1 Tax=Enterobacter kobei TaxID=208224 RepID=UPI002003C068|nr:hypothetical protein [Enterobacter kobei]MCK7109455.1 hypothetical protein [Enterobacter kobei]
MSNIDKLKSAAAKAVDNFDPNMFVETRDVLALLDELEAAKKRIAELSHHLQSAHAFIEHTEAFGHEASNGILCCGDAQWNIDESKSALAAAGKGEES